mmetsp:Transcript_28193/g.39660  ORF Transcript_28193/g.39660 Transcript_28193/m.39660 type:complete len:445 (+) Transcript_28193:39-1373(+)
MIAIKQKLKSMRENLRSLLWKKSLLLFIFLYMVIRIRKLFNLKSGDEIHPWLDHFQGENIDPSGRHDQKSFLRDGQCALNFFGLPRSFGDMVLPSIIKNVLKPNARYGCDVYVHYYKQDKEEAGRMNEGGELSTDDVFLLEDAVRTISQEYYAEENGMLPEKSRPAYRIPNVAFAHDTAEDFLNCRSEQLHKYQTETILLEGKSALKYYPWKLESLHKSSIDNMVKQWHSIQRVFELMDHYRLKGQIDVNYTRVGMFRSDCLYVTPIDILSNGRGTTSHPKNHSYDEENQNFVVPSFCNYPVNDRLIYGPYEAVKIWATKRFDLMETRAIEQVDPGRIMHQERFLSHDVFPVMEKKFRRIENGDICFLRTRAGGTVLLNDCSDSSKMTSKVWNQKHSQSTDRLRLPLLEAIVGTQCAVRWGNTRPNTFVASCGGKNINRTIKNL